MQSHTKKSQTIIIGGGQAGLSVGYYLQKQGIPFQILDANPRVGDAWRNRWDSLRLFTTARYTGLPGLPFPAPKSSFPTKDQMADYLESYAEHFKLPVENGVKVDWLSRLGDRFVIKSGKRAFLADRVVIAMSNYQKPKTPDFARELGGNIKQIHSFHYKNPSQLREGGVLIVGVGNSGADIAMDVVRGRKVWLSGKEVGHIPFQIESFVGRQIVSRIFRFVFQYVLSLGSPIGRRKFAALRRSKAPLVRVKPDDLIRAGVERVPRVVGVREGRPLLEDGRILDVANVIWCTGYDRGLSWIDLPVLDGEGFLKHKRGVVESIPGLYFVGQHFLYAMSSATLIGIGRDAKFVSKEIAAQAVSDVSSSNSRSGSSNKTRLDLAKA